MQQFAVLHAEKCNTVTKGLGQHIDRQRTPSNADPLKSILNQNLIRPQSDNLVNDVNNRIAEGYKGKKAIRKDAVKAFRIILSGSHERMKEIEQNPRELERWQNANIKFMRQRFGSDNLVRMTLHRDETTPHIHAVVVPITSDGRLSAKDFIDGPKALKQLQTDYAQAMQEFGLSRGRENSAAKHTDVKEYYGRVREQEKVFPEIEIPKKGLLEGAEDYTKRVVKSLAPVIELLEREKKKKAQMNSELGIMKVNLKETKQAVIDEFRRGVKLGAQEMTDKVNRSLRREGIEINLDMERMEFSLVRLNQKEEKKEEQKKDQKRDFGMNI